MKFRPSFVSSRGMAFRRLFGMCLGLITATTLGAGTALYALCSPLIPAWIAFNLFVSVPCSIAYVILTARFIDPGQFRHGFRHGRRVALGGATLLAIMNTAAIYGRGQLFSRFALAVRLGALTAASVTYWMLNTTRNRWVDYVFVGVSCAVLDLVAPFVVPLFAAQKLAQFEYLIQAVYWPRATAFPHLS